MNQATEINVVPGYGHRGELHFSQYDVGRTATIDLYGVNEAYTIPVAATVKIQATKPSGLGFDVACSFSGNVVTVVSTATMTEEAGRFPCELRITKDSDIIGTANIMFCVEPSPHPDGIIDGDVEQVVNQVTALVLEAEGYALGTQNGTPVTSESVYYHNNAKWLSDNAVLSDEVKQTLLLCFQNVAWIGNNGQTYYDSLSNALNRGAELLSISAVYTQGGTVYDTDTLDSLKSDLVVTASYDDNTTETVLIYNLSGTLTAGTSTITVTYNGKTTTFTVTVTARPKWLYHFDNSIASSGSKDFGLTVPTANYVTGVFDEAVGITANTPANVPRAFGMSSSNLPVLDGDFTITLWGKASGTSSNTMFRLVKNLGSTQITNSGTQTAYNGHTLTNNGTISTGYTGVAFSLVYSSNGFRPYFTFFTSTSTAYGFMFQDASANILSSGWHHFAVCRKDNITTFYVDGLKWSSFTMTETVYVVENFLIGGSVSTANTEAGITVPSAANPSIDEFMIIDGYALYDGEFSVPAEPYA